MADRPSFDVSNLDALTKIKTEQQSLRDLAARAAEHRDKVTEVYNRVVRDYETRVRALDEQAQHLRAQLREDFAKLDAVYSAAKQALDQARFDLQESEFRREIGEYGPDEFQRRQKTIEATIADKQRELEQISDLRARFVELLPGEPAAPAAPPPPPPPPPVVPLPVPKPIVEAASPSVPPPVPPTQAKPPAAPVPAAAAKSPAPPISAATSAAAKAFAAAPPTMSGIGETMVLPPPDAGDFRVPTADADEGATQILSAPPAAEGDEGAEAFATIAVAPGALIEERSGGAPVTHRLAMLTTIGRTPDNQIVIPSREVSRKHAEIVLGQAGYLLRDLGSPNGTFVNGQKVGEHKLQEGDRITLAGVTFVFKAK
jgi:hypothetical protein